MIVYTCLYFLLTSFSPITVISWMVKSLKLLYRANYDKSERLSFVPYHKDGSKYILSELHRTSFYAFFFYLSIHTCFIGSKSKTRVISFIITAGIGGFLWLFNFIAYSTTIYKTRYVAKDSTQLQSGRMENPFFKHNIDNIKNLEQERCLICEKEKLGMFYECGHACICFVCWNSNKNRDYRDTCMLCKQQSKKIRKFNVMNYTIDVEHSFIFK